MYEKNENVKTWATIVKRITDERTIENLERYRLQTTQHTSGGAVTADTNCVQIVSKPPAPSNRSPIYRF